MKSKVKKVRIFGSRINSSHPIGSIQLEREYHIENEDLKEFDEIDLLVIGIKPPHRNMSNKMSEGYYKFLNWLKNFSNSNTQIKKLFINTIMHLPATLKKKKYLNPLKLKFYKKEIVTLLF